ncbi:MAG: hypothetical protein PVH65_18790 [Chloroflexota bacterium]
MVVLSLVSIVAGLVCFGGVLLFTVLFVNKRFWTTFRASSLLGANPNQADLVFANGTALAVKSFPLVVVLAFIAAVALYISGRHTLAAVVVWLPILNFIVPILLFIIKIIVSR